MSSSLSRIPAPKRRQFAATLGLFAVLWIAVGAVAATGPGTVTIKAFVAIAFVVAALLALMAWGVAHSIKVDAAEQDLDAAIEAAVIARGGRMCDCGHDHDPTELHVTDDPCEQDGHGVECTHSCSTCVLAALRPKPAVEPAEELVGARPRPRPTPR